ncbi:MAG: SEFIR domain-containing protein [Pelagimonas sp.]|uniref:SEFIR domain-containing protein n=1 Tax=Pelagimonas sp. TaxID=2073170 RepID=UPI003D6ACB97
MTAIKVFISYSWTSPDHEDWVLRLATDLRESGVDAILDKWDLKEGHEANAFMEKMVSDPDISKVVIVSDRVYSEKSNKRTGGAGTEAQIISSEIFSKEDQNKFVVAVTELDDEGKAYVPKYYTSRIFIDFTDESKFAGSFEQLLRWIADKPIHKKPELGSLPKYISEPEEAVVLATSAAKRRAMDGLTNSKAFAYPATKEYLELLSRELEKFRLPSDVTPESDEFIENFQSFAPYRDECIEIVRAVSDYTSDEKYIELIHAFFERFQGYFHPPKNVNSYHDTDFDNFKFFAHELFLHVGATLISSGRYEAFNQLVATPYYLANRADRGQEPMGNFTEFRHYLKSLEIRKQNLKLNRLSLAADFLHDRAGASGIDFSKIMEVDFLLFLRAELADLDYYDRWYPDSLVYLGYGHRAFEIFERSRSKRYFERIRPVLGNATKEDLDKLVEGYRADPQTLPRWEGSRISPVSLMGIQNLCSVP